MSNFQQLTPAREKANLSHSSVPSGGRSSVPQVAPPPFQLHADPSPVQQKETGEKEDALRFHGGGDLSQDFVLGAGALPPDPNQGTHPVQRATQGLAKETPTLQKENNTGLPDDLKTGVESLSGIGLDDVKVHYNSHKPAQLQAHAYAQGSDIHLGPGQEKHLPHEAWHIVQQKQGRVIPTTQIGDTAINDDRSLESEADQMGAKALRQPVSSSQTPVQKKATDAPAQRVILYTAKHSVTGVTRFDTDDFLNPSSKPPQNIINALRGAAENGDIRSQFSGNVFSRKKLTGKDLREAKAAWSAVQSYILREKNKRRRSPLIGGPTKKKIRNQNLDNDKLTRLLIKLRIGLPRDGSMTWDDVYNGIMEEVGDCNLTNFMRELVQVIYGYRNHGGKQYTFPRTTAREEVDERYKTEILEVMEPKEYETEDEQILQQLRWISTTVFNYLQDQGVEPTEVQTLWDGKKLHITENKVSNNSDIRSLLNNPKTLKKFLKKYRGKDKHEDRFKRHPAKVREGISNKKRRPQGPMGSLHDHLYTDKDRLSTPRFGFGEMHAEIRLTQDYLRDRKFGKSRGKPAPEKVYVAGVKRPCFVCHSRLDSMKSKYENQGIDLVSNPHKGLLWPSASALEGATLEDKQHAIKHLGLKAFINYKKTSDYKKMKSFIKKNHFYLTENEGVGTYAEDTESEIDSDSDVEYYEYDSSTESDSDVSDYDMGSGSIEDSTSSMVETNSSEESDSDY